MHPADPIRVREIWPPGTVIKGDFVVEKKLGSGGFGTVYIARHRFFNTIHVIKRLHEQYASDEEYVRKFVNEGRAVRRLKGCPYVVEVEHMTQSEDGHLILVMEHVAGGDLAALMETRALRVDEVVAFGRQIALGLEAAHQAGLIHRDIKPQNVLISHDSTGKLVLKLIDFGIAADHQGTGQTSLMRGGSLGYAAPEQWMRAGKELDGRTDLYSLGATMYRMLCGRMPYPNDGDVWPWLHRVSQGPPEAPSAVRADCPAWLSDLIVAMLAYAPEGRPASAAEVARRLDGAPAATTATTVVYPSSPVVPTVVEKTPSKIGAWIASGVAAMALAIGGTWYAMQPKQAETPAQPEVKQEVVKPREPEPEPPPAQKQPETKKKAEAPPPKPTAAAKPEVKQEAVKPREPDPEPLKPPPVNHAALGDAARNAGDFRAALRHYREAGDAAKVAAVQRAVEGDTEERAGASMDRRQFADALRVVDGWLKEFPDSQRLQRLRARIVRARDSQ